MFFFQIEGCFHEKSLDCVEGGNDEDINSLMVSLHHSIICTAVHKLLSVECMSLHAFVEPDPVGNKRFVY